MNFSAAHLTRLICCILLAAATVQAAEADALKQFDDLFGREMKIVLASQSTQDDLDLAKVLFEAAGKSQADPFMLRVLCEKSADLSEKDPQGLEPALAALGYAADQVPEARLALLSRISNLYQLTYNRARNEQRVTAGDAYIAALLRQADTAADESHFEEAVELHRKAGFVATSIRSDQKDRIKLSLDQIQARQQVHAAIESAREKIQADPQNAAAAEELVRLLVVERDLPAEARKYTFLIKDETLKTNVPLASTTAQQLDADQSYAVAEWYQELVETARNDRSRLNMLRRSHLYYTRFLELHTDQTLQRTKAEVTRHRLATEVTALRQKLGLNEPARVTATIATPPASIAIKPGQDRKVDAALATWFPQRDAATPAEQVNMVVAKLGEANGGVNINLRNSRTSDEKVQRLNFRDNPRLKNIDPLQGMPLDALYIQGSAIEDLEALRGIPLQELTVSETPTLRRIDAIQGMSLNELSFRGASQLNADLSILKGMPLRSLGLSDCEKIESLRGIEGLPLHTLYLSNCKAIKDLTPAQGMKLRRVYLAGCSALESLEPLRGIQMDDRVLNLEGCRSLRGNLSVFSQSKFQRVYLNGCQKLESLEGVEGMPLDRLHAEGCENLTVDFKLLENSQLRELNLRGAKAVKNLQLMVDLPIEELNIDIQQKTSFKSLPALLVKMPALRRVITGIPAVDQELERTLRLRPAR